MRLIFVQHLRPCHRHLYWIYQHLSASIVNVCQKSLSYFMFTWRWGNQRGVVNDPQLLVYGRSEQWRHSDYDSRWYPYLNVYTHTGFTCIHWIVLNMRIGFRPAARSRLFYSLTAAFGPLRLKEQEEQKKAQIKEKEGQKKSRWVKNLSYLCQWITKTF